MRRAVVVAVLAVTTLALADAATARTKKPSKKLIAACLTIGALDEIGVNFVNDEISSADVVILESTRKTFRATNGGAGRRLSKLVDQTLKAPSERRANALVAKAVNMCDDTLPASATSTTTTTAPPTPPQIANGTGDSVLEVTFPAEPAIAHLIGRGSANFIVQSYDAAGQPLDLLVNTIGAYEGFRPLNFLNDQHTTRLQIQADGAWTVEIKPLRDAHTATVPGHFDDHGDDVVLLQGPTDTAHFVNTGGANFIVQSYGSTRELLVNEIGAYDGTVIIPSDASTVLEVQSDGAWSVDFN